MGLCRSFRLKRLEALVHTVPVAMLGPEDMLTTQPKEPKAVSARLPRAGTSLRLTRLEALAHNVPAALLRSTWAHEQHYFEGYVDEAQIPAT